MSFSAATCLTDTPFGVTSFNVYLGQNNYASPNLIASLVPVSDLTVNCPYIINNIPGGTTYLSFKDSSGTYCISIPIQDNNICSNCNLGFSNYSATTISKIYCGILTGSCQTNITDYLIHWYGPDDTTTLSFTSGRGSIFSYQYQHPFSTEPTSIPRESGVYTPVIQNVILNGISYSNTGGTGNILFSGNCLPTTNVLPLTCSVRTNNRTDFPYSAYTNYLSFDSETQGTPLPFSSTYKISASTKYIAWAFKGEDAVDRLKISFSGSTSVIGLEDVIIGSELTSCNFNSSIYPKSAQTPYYLTKLTCLTGLTINNNDNIIINITPAENNTYWELFITCLDDYNCDDCLLTQDYKIIGNTITGVTGTCNTLNVNFKVSGCSGNDINSDYLTYYQSFINYPNKSNVVVPNSTLINVPFGDMYFYNSRCIPNIPSIPSICQTDSTPTIYKKTFLTDGSGRGVFGFTGSSTFISTYYDSIRNAFLGLPPYNSNWSGSTNNTDLSYYRIYSLQIPQEISSDGCGDVDVPFNIYLHHTSQYITGITIDSKFYLSLTANTITQNIFYNECFKNCTPQIQSRIVLINDYSTGATPSKGTNMTFNSGLYYTNPIYIMNYSVLNNDILSASTVDSYFLTPDWSFNTYPFSGDPSIIIPSLSGTVCNYMSIGKFSSALNSFYKTNYKFYYQVRMTNYSNANDFDIWASPISNFTYSGSPGTPFYELAYRNSGGTITTNPTYII